MRTESEIREALKSFDTIGNEDASCGAPVQDLFQLGMYVGKQVALGWALHDTPSSILGTHFTLADWQRERREARFHEQPPAVEG